MKDKIANKVAEIFLAIMLKGSRRFGKGFAFTLAWPFLFIAKAALLRRKRKFMLENIRAAIPDKSQQFYDAVIQKSLQHSLDIIFSHVAGDVKLTAPSRSVIDDIIHSKEKGAIVITTHHGDWEGVLRFFGNLQNCSAGNFYNRPSNKAVDRFLIKLRNCEQFASGEGNVKKIIERFKHSEGNGSFFVVVAIDLYTKRGLDVDFLHRKTLFSDGSLRIAAEAGVPIIAATSLVKNGETEISFSRIEYDPEELKASEECARETLQKVMSTHSDAIVADPEQWLFWSQNLWKRRKTPVK